MVTTPQMGLRVWNLTTDAYDSGQLAGNWQKVDEHDHSPGRGNQIPSSGIQDGAVTSAKLSSGILASPAPASVSLESLASDVTTDYGYAFSTYKSITERQGQSGGVGASTQLMGFGSGPGGVNGFWAASGNGAGSTLFYLDPTDFSAGTRTTYYRTRVSLTTNATAPGITYTVGLYPVTASAGGSGVISLTLGSVAAGSTVAFVTPGASSRNQSSSGDFVAPAAGYFAMGIVFSGSESVNSASAINVRLQVRQQ